MTRNQAKEIAEYRRLFKRFTENSGRLDSGHFLMVHWSQRINAIADTYPTLHLKKVNQNEDK